MDSAARHPRSVAPDLRDRRGDATLLVWGGLAQWLVVDDELLALLALVDGTRSFEEVVATHATRTGTPVARVVAEAGPVLDTLVTKGIIEVPGRAPRRIEEPATIANVTYNITNRCNLRCSFCYNSRRKGPELSIDRVMDAVVGGPPVLADDASFIILGGEPFLDASRLLRAIQRANESFRLPVLVSTNGTRLDQPVVDELVGRRVEVQVSLDRPHMTGHDASRGPGTFEAATTGLCRLVDAGVRAIASMVYTAETIDEIEPFLALAEDLGVDEARIIPLRLIGGGVAHGAVLPNQHSALAHLLDILQRRPSLGRLLGRDYFSIATATCRFSMARTGCGVGRRVIFVDADGTVYPCPNHVLDEVALGSLADTTLGDLVTTSPTLAALARRYVVDNYTRCRTCPFRHWCAGDCRGEVLSTTGDPFAPSPHCGELRAMYREMMWLVASGDGRLGTSATTSEGRRAVDQFSV